MTQRALTPGQQRRALVVANEQTGRPEEAIEHALQVLRSHHIDCIRATPLSPQRLLTVIREGRADHDVVILAGGDGTLNMALPALLGDGAPLGILPLGTANDLARTLNLPTNPAEAARVIATGRTSHIDVGRVNGRYFFNVAHVGVGAGAHSEVTAVRKRWWGALAYPVAVARTLWSYHPFMARIHVDKQRRRLLAMHIAIGNGRYFGGGIPITENAGIRDARLDVSCVRAGGLATLFGALGAIVRGAPGPQSVWRAEGRHVELYTRRPRRIIADGEEVGYTPAVFDVEAGAVPVIIPGD
ncbi:MAG: lipid kinase [Aquisalimonadaceae bacterium]